MRSSFFHLEGVKNGWDWIKSRFPKTHPLISLKNKGEWMEILSLNADNFHFITVNLLVRLEEYSDDEDLQRILLEAYKNLTSFIGSHTVLGSEENLTQCDSEATYRGFKHSVDGLVSDGIISENIREQVMAILWDAYVEQSSIAQEELTGELATERLTFEDLKLLSELGISFEELHTIIPALFERASLFSSIEEQEQELEKFMPILERVGPHKILGFTSFDNLSLQVLKKKYYKLSNRYHPDKSLTCGVTASILGVFQKSLNDAKEKLDTVLSREKVQLKAQEPTVQENDFVASFVFDATSLIPVSNPYRLFGTAALQEDGCFSENTDSDETSEDILVAIGSQQDFCCSV